MGRHLRLCRRPQLLRLNGISLIQLTGVHVLAKPPENPTLTTPVAHACVSSPFGRRILLHRPLAGNFHNGIDLPAHIGEAVVAIAPGKIIRVQRRGVGGLEILVQHPGFIGVYSHLGLIAPMIAEGVRTVDSGQRLATVGRSGLTYGPHLFFGMIVDGQPVDPAPYLGIKACDAQAPAPPDAPIRSSRAFIQH